MLTNKLHQALIRLLMIIIISQIALMNVSNLQFNYFPETTTESAYTPCPKSSHTSLSTSKICEKQGADAFVKVDSSIFVLMNSPMNVFFALTLLFAYATPIYPIDRPPKH